MQEKINRQRKFKLEHILEKKYLKSQIKLEKNKQLIKDKIERYK